MAFVQDVAKGNDGVNYLLVVIDVLSKYLWVRPMKNKTSRSLLEAFDSILSEGRNPDRLRELSLSMAGKGVEGKYFFLEQFSCPSDFFV